MKLKDYLETSGLTQAEFAIAAQTTQGRLSHLIARGEMPSLGLAQRIRDASDGAVGLDEWSKAEPAKAA